MRFVPGDLPGIVIVEPRVVRDGRGYFLESYHLKKYQEAGIPETFVQDNHSCSVGGTIRGLHFQLKHPQGKLVRVIEGEIFDVAVDVRQNSATFGKWCSVVLSADNFRQVYLPPGFAHGFAVTSNVAQVEYKCTSLYDPTDEAGIAWNDPTLAISWPVVHPKLSARDERLPLLAEVFSRTNA